MKIKVTAEILRLSAATRRYQHSTLDSNHSRWGTNVDNSRCFHHIIRVKKEKMLFITRRFDVYSKVSCSFVWILEQVRVSQEQEHFLLNPFGLLYSEVTASSLIKVDMQVSGMHLTSIMDRRVQIYEIILAWAKQSVETEVNDVNPLIMNDPFRSWMALTQKRCDFIAIFGTFSGQFGGSWYNELWC